MRADTEQGITGGVKALGKITQVGERGSAAKRLLPSEISALKTVFCWKKCSSGYQGGGIMQGGSPGDAVHSTTLNVQLCSQSGPVPVLL